MREVRWVNQKERLDINIWKEKIRQMKKEQWLIVLLIGILLLVISLPTKESENETKADSAVQDAGEEDEEKSMQESFSYEQQLEARLEDILSRMEGVGQVQVMLSVDEEENSSLYTSSNNVPSVTGVLILCDGADDATVVQNISDAVMALFQIEIHKIKVGKRTTKGESP